ncbi:MAG: acetamidase/formamidase family protein [Actinomycetota bacterium]|nr:acetamidase/formamidase family protein [Actinomycetota bacterium]
MSREHVMDPQVIHHGWDLDLPPALEIASGDVVNYDVQVAGEGQVWLGAALEETKFDFATIYNLSGPLFVKGAEPGDTLQIDVLELDHGDWGWSASIPGFGLLADEFPEGYLRTFDIRGRDSVSFAPGVEVPLGPFLGTMGNHPGEPRQAAPFPPHQGGGNIDNRHLTRGTTLWLPVHVEGGMFSCGDPHAVQGDGEVCLTAVEAPATTTLRFTLHKKSIAAPSFRVPPNAVRDPNVGGYHATMGISPDLLECSRMATRAMIEWLQEEQGLSREDSYILCSIAGDLKVIEVVDAGMWNVAMTMPLSIFG